MKANDIVDIAVSEVGKCEIPLGSNWGPHVKKYLNSVGINFPASWCMAFVYWVINEACKKHGIENKWPKTGGVLKFFQGCPKEKIVKDPKPGDVFIMDYGKGLGHTGIVWKLDKTFVYTIEGNTNDSGSREGIEVCLRQRPISKIKAFIRII